MNVTGNKAKLFWSGGWDSTFELCRLSLKPIQVQPIYIVMDRPFHTGQEYEIKAQNKIIEQLRNRPTTKANILPITRINRGDIRLPKNLEESYHNFGKSFNSLGHQYLYMGAFAYNHPGIRVMISDYAHSRGRTMSYIRKGNFQFDDEGTGYILKKDTPTDVFNIFGKLYFPIAGFDQTYIVDWINQHEFWDVMDNSWTCFYPINGKPCGFCHCCVTKIKQGLDRLLSPEALKRGFVYNYLEKEHEFEIDKSKRLHYWFCVWLRLKYNPEISKMKLNYNNLSDITERAKRTEPEIRNLFKNEEIRNFVFKYNDYFESLLASDIECRTANDRNQWWGLR